MKKFKIRLKHLHDKTGLSAYAVNQQVPGITLNTIKKYVAEEEVISDVLTTGVLQLIAFYGADWKDPNVLEIIEGKDEAPSKCNQPDDQGQSKTPLAATA